MYAAAGALWWGNVLQIGVLGCYSYSKGQRGGPILGMQSREQEMRCAEKEGMERGLWGGPSGFSSGTEDFGLGVREACLLIGSGRVNVFTSETVAMIVCYFRS